MLASALQVVGAAVLSIGCAMVAPWLGLVVCGCLLVAFGVALARPGSGD